MAISVQGGVLAWRRVAQFASNQTPAVQLQLKALKEFVLQHLGNPDLEFVPFDELSSTDVVMADAACKLVAAVFIKDTATAAWAKLTDHATTGSDTAPEIGIKLAAIGATVLTYPQKLAFANGITGQGSTTADGGTGSSSDGPKGFVLIAAA
jgi:hypothetical protein